MKKLKPFSGLFVVLFLALAGWRFGNPNGPAAIVSNINNAPAWQATHSYNLNDTVVNSTSPLRGYRVITAGTSAGSGGPTTTGANITDGSVHWKYLSDVQFQSITAWISSIPTTNPPPCGSPYNITMAAPYTGLLWNGGEYNIGGSTIIFAGQTDNRLFCGENPPQDVPSRNFTPAITLTPAPGEGFRDSGTHVALAYNAANGVAIHNNFSSTQTLGGATIAIVEGYIVLDGLQIKNDSGWGVYGGDNFGVVKNCIVDAGDLGISLDYLSQITNDLVIARGSIGIMLSYNTIFDHVTLVHPGGGASLGLLMQNPGFGNGYVTVRNSVFMGFAYASSTVAAGSNSFSSQSDNNAIDLASNSTIGNTVSGGTTNRMPGSSTLFSVPFDGTTFVNAASDFRLATGSTLIGAGLLGTQYTVTATTSIPATPVRLIATNSFSPQGSPSLDGLNANVVPIYPGMSLSGSGIPAGNTMTAIGGGVNAWLLIVNPATITGTFTATYTSTWHPFDDLDILGTPRGVAGASEDIGAIQWTP